jgi:glutamate/aspartate transport system substrate-binding protein
VRGNDVQFAINYFYTGTRLLAKKSSPVNNYADLAKKKVATTSGTTNAQVLRKYNRDNNLDMDLVMGKDHDDSFLLVETGRAEAFAMDDILLFGLMGNARTPADWKVVGDSLQVEPYACMLRKDDPQFQALVNGVIGGMMKSGEFEKLYTKWFMSPIPPRKVNLQLPMSKELRDNLTAQSDKPAV